LATKAKLSSQSRHLKRRMRALGRRLKDDDFLDAWCAGQHLSAETQKSQAQEELASLQNELAAVETADVVVGIGRRPTRPAMAAAADAN